jgi:hypothetical protein
MIVGWTSPKTCPCGSGLTKWPLGDDLILAFHGVEQQRCKRVE